MKMRTRFFPVLLALLIALALPLGAVAASKLEPGDLPCPHDWDWHVVQKPSCTEQGVARAVCKLCGANGVSYSDPTGHVFGDWTAVPAGEGGSVLYERTCKVCGTTEYDNGGLSVDASVDGAPPHEGDPCDYYEPDDVVMFMVFVNNTGSHTYTNVTVSDPLVPGNVLRTYDEGGPGFTDTIEVPYTVTDGDLAAGCVTNSAGIQGQDENDLVVMATSGTVTVYVALELDQDTDDGTPIIIATNTPFGVINDVTVLKEEKSSPARNGMYNLNEEIEYTITVTNNGEIPVYNVRVYDEFNFTIPQELLDTIPVLNPSDSRTYSYKHKVTNAEMYGVLYNKAFIKYNLERAGGRDEFSQSKLVIVYTGDIIDPPRFPTPMDGDSCVLTLTGAGDNGSAWEQHYCSDHEDVKKQAAAILAGSADADACKQVRALWQAAAEEEYNDLYEIANPAAKAVALNDRMCFFNEVTAAENLVLALTGDEALAAKTAAAMLENRCCSLCYELHNAPADRSELAGFSAFTAADECAYTVTGTGTNDIAGGLAFCAEHAGEAVTAALDDRLLTLAANDADNESVIRYYITSLASRRAAHATVLNVLYGNDDIVNGMLLLNDQMRIALICGLK